MITSMRSHRLRCFLGFASLMAVLPIAQAQQAQAAENLAYVPISGEDSVYVIDTATDSVIDRIRNVGNHPTVLRVTPDRSKIYVDNFGPLSSDIGVIDTKTRRVTKRIPTAGYPYASIALSADGRYLFVPTVLSKVQVIDTRTDKVIHTYPVGLLPFGIEASPDGGRFYAFFPDNTAAVYDTATGKQIGSRLPTGEFPGWSALSEDGDTLYIFNLTTNDITVIDTPSWRVTGTISLPDTAKNMYSGSLTPDGKRIYVCYRGSGNLVVVDLATQSVTDILSMGEAHPDFIGFSPDGKRAYVSDLAKESGHGNFFTYSSFPPRPGHVIVYDTASNTPVDSIDVGTAPIAGVYY